MKWYGNLPTFHHFHILHLIYLIPIYLLFGPLTTNETNILINRLVGYTIWEFTFGYILNRDDIHFINYISLFLLITLLKSFHYLLDERLDEWKLNETVGFSRVERSGTEVSTRGENEGNLASTTLPTDIESTTLPTDIASTTLSTDVASGSTGVDNVPGEGLVDNAQAQGLESGVTRFEFEGLRGADYGIKKSTELETDEKLRIKNLLKTTQGTANGNGNYGVSSQNDTKNSFQEVEELNIQKIKGTGLKIAETIAKHRVADTNGLTAHHSNNDSEASFYTTSYYYREMLAPVLESMSSKTKGFIQTEIDIEGLSSTQRERLQSNLVLSRLQALFQYRKSITVHTALINRVTSFGNPYQSFQIIKSEIAGKSRIYKTYRLALGLITVHFIDILIISKYFWKLSSRPNVFLGIFGLEILQLYPSIFITSLKFFNIEKRKLYITEFVVNLLRFFMLCFFGGIFGYWYFLPIHILPSTYLSLKLVVSKARNLLNFKKNQLVLEKLETPLKFYDHCIVCFDDFDSCQSSRQLKCGHMFHYDCIKSWLDYSRKCPICRKEV